MDRAELTALLTPEGLRLVDELGAMERTDEVATAVSRLRAAGLAPDLVSAAVGQARLQTRTRQKFGVFADRMLFTRAGLEQATRLEVGARHAGRFRDAGLTRVADLGCGIGGDALAFAGIGLDVLAVEADEVTAALAAYNLAPFGDAARVVHARAEDADLTGIEAVWLDPARRTAGHTETTRVGAGEWSPALEWVWQLASRHPAGVKLGPAFDRTLVPDDAEAQWISVDGSTIELVVWTGRLARPGIRRAALVIRGGAAAEITGAADAEDAGIRDLGAYLHEPEGAVIRARLIGAVARGIGAGMLDPRIAYLTSDAPALGPDGSPSPFVQSFRVRERLPNDVKALGRALRERGIGTLEIKKRGVDVDPAALRTTLKLRGTASATLLLTRVGDRRLTLLADRV